MLKQAELERLKRQHAEREAQKQAERVAAGAAASFAGRADPAQAHLPAQGPPQMTEELRRTLKVLLSPICAPLQCMHRQLLLTYHHRDIHQELSR